MVSNTNSLQCKTKPSPNFFNNFALIYESLEI